jgi:hypothetical protein
MLGLAMRRLSDGPRWPGEVRLGQDMRTRAARAHGGRLARAADGVRYAEPETWTPLLSIR